MSTPSPDEALGMENDPYIDEREHAREAGSEDAEPAEHTAEGEETGPAGGR